MNEQVKEELWKILNGLTPITKKEFEKSFQLFKPAKFDKGDYLVKSGQLSRHIAFINKGVNL
jgi:hypothetical protein